MSQPHVCPVCRGTGRVEYGGTSTTVPLCMECPACHGACVLWEPEAWPDTLPELTEWEKRALDSLGPDFVKRLLSGELSERLPSRPSEHLDMQEPKNAG